MTLSNRIEKINADFNAEFVGDLDIDAHFSRTKDVKAFYEKRIKEEVAHAFEVTGEEKVPESIDTDDMVIEYSGETLQQVRSFNKAIQTTKDNQRKYLD